MPHDLLIELGKAKIVITNYHAFKLRERLELSKGNRALLQGRGEALDTLESEGQMLQRVMPDLMGLKNIMILSMYLVATAMYVFDSVTKTRAE